MIKLMLNTHKFNNYAFFCPVSRLHLTVSSPVGFANEVTPAISKALKAETILDVDGVINIETGTVEEIKQANVKNTEKPAVQAPVQEVQEQKKAEPVKTEEPVKKVEEPVKAEKATEATEESAESKKGTKKAALFMFAMMVMKQVKKRH